MQPETRSLNYLIMSSLFYLMIIDDKLTGQTSASCILKKILEIKMFKYVQEELRKKNYANYFAR